MINNVGNKIGGTFNNIKGHFGHSGNNQNYANQISQRKNLQYLIEAARSKYELSNISDQQIEDALIKTNNNIDDAVILLTTQNN